MLIFSKEPYPNPFTDKLSMKLDLNDKVVILKLLDRKGDIHYYDIVYTVDGEISFNTNVPEGSYSLQIISDNYAINHSVLKLKAELTSE
jgi:hypothetical protein